MIKQVSILYILYSTLQYLYQSQIIEYQLINDFPVLKSDRYRTDILILDKLNENPQIEKTIIG